MAVYQTIKMINKNVPDGSENIILAPSETFYTRYHALTMEDATHGFFIGVKGECYGGDVKIQLQQALSPEWTWEDIGSAVVIGTGGTDVAPTAIDKSTLFPASAITPYMPFIRIKFTTAAVTNLTASSLVVTQMGVK